MSNNLTNSNFQKIRNTKISENKTAYMKAILIEQCGILHTLWLPNIIKGRYQFQKDTGLNLDLQIYIEGKDNQWFAYTEKNAAFHTTDGKRISKQALYDKMITNIYDDKGQEYVLFVEISKPEDNCFFFYSLKKQAVYTIGRELHHHICYPHQMVSGNHASLQWKDDSFYIIDNNSTNGTYLNGQKMEPCVPQKLTNGDFIFIMGLYILIGSRFLAINNANGRVKINTSDIYQIKEYDDFIYTNPLFNVPHIDPFDRQPHKQKKLTASSINIEMPPMPLYANKVPLLLRMGSPMVIGGHALASGNFAMALTSLVFPALTQGITERDRKEYEEKRTSIYRKYLSGKKQEILNEKDREEYLLNDFYPPLSVALQFAFTKKHLWEKQKSDSDFLNIRIGTGDFPMIAKKTFPERKFELESDHLTEEMYALAEETVFLNNVPIMLSLQQDYIVGILGTPQQKAELIHNLMMQIVLTHSYDEVKLILILNQEDAAIAQYIRYLPHNWNNSRNIRFLASTPADALQISEYLNKELGYIHDESNRENALKKMPSYVVIALDKKLFDCVEIFKELLIEESYCGVSILAAFDGIPKECRKIIDLRTEVKTVDLTNPENDEQTFALDSYQKDVANSSMHALMKIKLKIESESYLPDTLSFLEMYGVGRVEHLNPLKRWNDNNPVNSLSAAIGVGANGKLFTLDLHQKAHGPHGLVAGMTGSGKSEFLITYILSMAVNYSPDEVAFILIDYKGGGLADAFEDKERQIHLPHLVGTITNLDGNSIQRSLMSINSELTRRQRVFKEAKQQCNEGTLDIYDYQRLYRNKKVSEPMPHLIIIADEFAELKKQQQEFMDKLISAARIGRSLGIHLILATQKPGGVVDEQIWSNAKFHVCLRVQDRGDSMEMLKRPEAAELKHTGRFYLQVGYNEYFALGQSAWCGGDYFPQDEPPTEQDNTIRFLDNAGQTILDIKPNIKKKQAEHKQVVAITQYLSDLAKQENIEPKNLWKNPLPKELELDSFIKNTNKADPKTISALIGLVDDPENQRQFPLFLPLLDFHNMLLVGASGSGKSTFLRTMLYSLICRYSPSEVNYYVIDLSDGALSGYAQTPHCGAYLTQENDADIGRLLTFIREIIAQRKKMFAEAEIYDFNVYRQLNALPLILFIVDGFTNIQSLRNGEKYFLLFQDYLREGTSFGIRIILSCNHDNEVGSKSKQELDYRIALQAKDRYEYNDILGANVRCTYTPAAINGRGMCLQEQQPLEYHTAMLDCDKPEPQRAELLRQKLSDLAQRYKDCTPAKCLPMANLEQTYEHFCLNFETGRIPLGYSLSDMKTVSIPFQQLHSISLYFGNPKGIARVFQNLLFSAEKNDMDIYIIQRQTIDAENRPIATVFDVNSEPCALSEFHGNFTMLSCSKKDITNLSNIIQQEIRVRNIYRDEYSIQKGIPLEQKKRSLKAAKYIRKHTIPIMVIIENFSDFCKACKEENTNNSELEGLFDVYFNQMRGYNIYFAAGFYPDDGRLSSYRLFHSYNAEEFFMLFGGHYDKIQMKNIPYEISKIDAINSQHNYFWMKYRENFYPMIMPIGQLDTSTEDPDDESII